MDKIDLIQRIENYLAAGGLANPELMDHERVRDLIIDCRDALAHPNAAAQHWHDLYKAKCKDLHDRQAMLGAEIAALEEEIEELKDDQPEPAFKLSDAGTDTNIVRRLEPKGEGMVALNQPEQEPCGWQFFQDGMWHNGLMLNNHRQNTEDAGYPVRDVYPPSERKEWVGLTDVAIARLQIDFDLRWLYRYTRAIEAQCKDLNG